MSNKKVADIIEDLDAEIDPIQKDLDSVHARRLAAWDFEVKNYLSGIESKHERAIELLNKAKQIVLKHLGPA